MELFSCRDLGHANFCFEVWKGDILDIMKSSTFIPIVADPIVLRWVLELWLDFLGRTTPSHRGQGRPGNLLGTQHTPPRSGQLFGRTNVVS